MRRFLKWLHCAMSAHPISVTHLESFAGVLHASHETCSCGSRTVPQFPGFLFKVHREAYEGYPAEYPPFLDEDTH